MEESATSDPDQVDATPAWLPMPTVLWPWACQLVVVDAATAAVDLIASEPRRVRGSTIEAGTPFSIRVTGSTESASSDLAVVAEWAMAGARVTLMASQHRRSSWVCLSRGHQRVVLTGVESHLRVDTATERTDPAPPDLEPQPATQCTSQ